MSRLLLVRHGRTVFNEQRLLQGWSDSPLTPDGVAGVAVTADALADHPITAAYASPLGRTVATASMILAHHPDVGLVTDPRLMEYSFGELEEQSEDRLTALASWDQLFAEVLGGTHPGLPGGESATAFLGRVGAAFGEIQARHTGDDETVLVVSHGLTLLSWLILTVGAPPVPLPNGSITTVEVDASGPRLVTFAADPAGMGEPTFAAATIVPLADAVA